LNAAILEIPHGVRVLDPVTLLDSKCHSILGRASEVKKNTNAQDILFLNKSSGMPGKPDPNADLFATPEERDK
jgi:hypothetical protein